VRGIGGGGRSGGVRICRGIASGSGSGLLAFHVSLEMLSSFEGRVVDGDAGGSLAAR